MKDIEILTVLHICDYAAPYKGNFIDSLEALERYHNPIRNIYLFPARARHTEAEKWISELNASGKTAYIQEDTFWKNVLLFRRITETHQVDRVIRHFSDLRMDAILKLFYNSKRVVRFFHGGYVVKSTLKHRIKKLLWKHNHFVGVSDAVAEQVQRAFPGWFVVPLANAIHFERLDAVEPFERVTGISLLMMGWDYPRKGVDLAVNAVARLLGKHDLTLQIVGGMNEDAIRKLAREILGEDPEWIRYLPSTNQIGTYYHANDIFLSPSRREAFGYANIEAAYCENSIVLSRVDGQAQLLIEGAYWFERENVEELVSQLEEAILQLHSPERIALRRRVREQVLQTYSLEAWSRKLADLLINLK